MKGKATLLLGTLVLLTTLAGCSYNPFNMNNHTTGSPVSTVVGAGIGAGSVGLLGGSKAMMAVMGIAGGAVGYYTSTLRYEAGGVIQGGGQVYKIGDFVGIYIPTDRLFEPNTADLIPQSQPLLYSAAEVLARYPNNNIIISGNTSGFYRSRWEQKLSEARAQKVAAYFWNSGINDFREQSNDLRKLKYVGYGDYFPISSHFNNKGIRANSRIQIVSYPSNCDLQLDQRHVAVHNVGAVDNTSEIVNAPPTHCTGDFC